MTILASPNLVKKLSYTNTPNSMCLLLILFLTTEICIMHNRIVQTSNNVPLIFWIVLTKQCIFCFKTPGFCAGKGYIDFAVTLGKDP